MAFRFWKVAGISTGGLYGDNKNFLTLYHHVIIMLMKKY